MLKTIWDALSKKNMQVSDDNWIWGSREEWISKICKPKHQEKMTVLFMVDKCFGQDSRSRA